MTDIATQIANLMVDSGKTAADMTHAVKVLGNGSMQQGFSRIGNYFAEEAAYAATKGLQVGRLQGGIIGILGTAAIGGIMAYMLLNEKEKAVHDSEGRTILKAMETASVNEDTCEGNVATTEDINSLH